MPEFGDPPPVPWASDVPGTRNLTALLHEARGRGEREATAAAWQAIVAAEAMRVRGLVRGFRDDALPGGRFPVEEVDGLVEAAFARLHTWSGELVGRSPAELRRVLTTAALGVCREYAARAGEQDAAPVATEEHPGPPGAPLAAEHARELAELVTLLNDDSDQGLIAREMLHPAIGFVDHEPRIVLTMDAAQAPLALIAEAVGVAPEQIPSLRRRGLSQLHGAIGEVRDEDWEDDHPW